LGLSDATVTFVRQGGLAINFIVWLWLPGPPGKGTMSRRVHGGARPGQALAAFGALLVVLLAQPWDVVGARRRISMSAAILESGVSRDPDAGTLEPLSPPAKLLDIAGVYVSARGAWASLDEPGRRLVLRYNASAAPELLVRVVLAGSACLLSPAAWTLEILVDGQETNRSCQACDCDFNIAVSAGAHTIAARVLDTMLLPVVQQQVLVRLARESGNDGHHSTSFVPDEAPRAAAVLQEYAALHRRIVDPTDSGVAKRFLIVRSSHGLSNTQIEEVTGLLMAIVTRRALILDFSNDTYTGQRPVLEYDWPLDIWMEAMTAAEPQVHKPSAPLQTRCVLHPPSPPQAPCSCARVVDGLGGSGRRGD
jgi:hypothetical protein